MSGINYPKFKDDDKLHLNVLILEANAFKMEIITAINVAKQSEEGLSFKEILRNLTPLTIENYDDSPSNTYKSTWNSRIHQMLRILDVPFVSLMFKLKKKYFLRFEYAFLLLEIRQKWLGKNSFLKSFIEKERKKSDDSEYISRSTTTKLSSSSAGSVSNTKQEKLLPIDKENIKLLYGKLDPAKMWKLSSSVLVEKKMEEFALKCNYEQ